MRLGARARASARESHVVCNTAITTLFIYSSSAHGFGYIWNVCVRIRKYYVRVCRPELFMSYTFAIIVFIALALEGGGWKTHTEALRTARGIMADFAASMRFSAE